MEWITLPMVGGALLFGNGKCLKHHAGIYSRLPHFRHYTTECNMESIFARMTGMHPL